MKKVLIKVDGKEYPFYKTMRGVLEFGESGFNSQQMLAGDVRAILQFIFCYVRGACMREAIEFTFDFETFVDKVDENAIERIESFLKSQHVEEQGEGAKKNKPLE